MQQQYAPASGLYSANRPTRDLLITDVGPVVGKEIQAPRHVVVRSKVLLNGVLPQQPWNAKKWGDCLGIAKRIL